MPDRCPDERNSSSSSPRSPRATLTRRSGCWSTIRSASTGSEKAHETTIRKTRWRSSPAPAASAPAGATAAPSPCGWPKRARWCSRSTATRRASKRRCRWPGDARASIKPCACDVTSSASVAAMASGCVEAFGTIDILVNNVGGSAAGGPVEMAEDVWDSQVDVNLKSVFLTCKHVLPTMLGQALRRHRQHRVDLGPALDRQRAGGLCGDEGRRDPAFARGRGAARARRASASTRVVPGQLHTPMVETRLAKQRTGGDVDALLAQRQKRIPLGFMGDGRDTATRRALPRQRRRTLHHRHRTRRRRRHDGALRLTTTHNNTRRQPNAQTPAS